jgi:uncharacterized membrane protein YeaQ/YmgE (transglycosylase-associated protein family)
MKTKMEIKNMKVNRKESRGCYIIVQMSAVLILLTVLMTPCYAASEASVTEQASVVVSESAQTVTDGITTLQEKVADSRLVNRTNDDVLAFILMGVLVASVFGIFSKRRCSGLGIAGLVGLGLIGAYIGSMVVRIAQIDLGWSEVVLNYEELLFSLLGAIAVVALARLIKWQIKKKKAKS